MKSNNMIKIIFTLCSLLGVGSLFYSPQTLAQQQSDSSMLKPSSPTRGSLQQASSNTGGPTMQTATTRTEERYGTCPAGKVGVTSRTSRFLEAYRNITTYRLHGQVVGETVGPWIDNNEDCTGLETQSLACPPLMKGDYIQERTGVTGDSRKNDNTAWKTVKYTCDYYFIRNDYETRSLSCPSGYSGSKTERRDFQVWSNNNRAYSAWYVNRDSCTPNRRSGYLSNLLVSVRGTESGQSISCHGGSCSTTPASLINSLRCSHCTSAGVAIHAQTGLLSCVYFSGTTSSSGESSADVRSGGIYPPGVSRSGRNSRDAKCTSSGGGTSIRIDGGCDRTSGGDADMCMAGYGNARVISNSGCSVTVEYSKNRNAATTRTFNICN